MTLPQWSRKTMLLNMALFYPMLLLGGYLLWETYIVFFWIYLFMWIGILTLGRYYVCRPCPYCGQDCPSFGFSYLALLFPKSKAEGFNRCAGMIDIVFIFLSLLLPIAVWILSFFGKIAAFSTIKHILIAAYLILAAVVVTVHQVTGCSKCEIAECQASKAAKEKKMPVK
ncbi:MAG: hypothetical protein GTO45_21420 [Candidatus Aminicenantes bacterium]|nr:hypothetical protein [Candidatus Aminicenantes bacterium]NIM81316.1 hypothetical protein [Candidatus Aminicenantes bacterium]NIN20726.1 hypothetical protein [Candidatus Aminicenantes bacterium]NIN44504.1 hypothetical protein [Candidatus Aminicenantes bacterium]NIN87324.1 hypothetical protein [Candidatus Aminicenantes bacterium]